MVYVSAVGEGRSAGQVSYVFALIPLVFLLAWCMVAILWTLYSETQVLCDGYYGRECSLSFVCAGVREK